METTYVDGKQHGLYQEWHSNGTKYGETRYIDGKLHGLHQEWYSDGTSSGIYEYKDNLCVCIISIRDTEGKECTLGEGELIVWKACKSDGVNVYVKLKIPAEAKRMTPKNPSHSHRYKGRVEYAQVIQIIDKGGNEYKSAKSFVYGSLLYEVGKEVRPNGYDNTIINECGKGINVHLHKDHCDQWFN